MVDGQFRRYTWDPLLIISQICAIQSIFYISFGVILIMLNQIVQRHISVKQVFDIEMVDLISGVGRIQFSAFILNSLVCAAALWFIVQRAKQCLDFTFTAHFIHFVCCCIITGFPKNWVWWLMNFISVCIGTLLSEFLCMQFEMKAIPVTTSGVS